MQLSELEPLVIEWAKEKGLIQHTTEQALAQHGKTKEEVGELLEAIERYESIIDPSTPQLDVTARVFAKEVLASTRKAQSVQVGNIRLEAGDVLVTLVIQCAIQRTNLDSALQAEGAIKDLRKRVVTIESFIRSEEPNQSLISWAVGMTVHSLDSQIRPYGLTLEECLEAAWKKIKGRKGQTVDGVFVKESVQ